MIWRLRQRLLSATLALAYRPACTCGATDHGGGSMGWRGWLSIAGAGLALLPLAREQWLAASVAAIVGALVVSAWAWLTSSDRKWGVIGGVVLIVLLAAA